MVFWQIFHRAFKNISARYWIILFKKSEILNKKYEGLFRLSKGLYLWKMFQSVLGNLSNCSKRRVKNYTRSMRDYLDWVRDWYSVKFFIDLLRIFMHDNGLFFPRRVRDYTRSMKDYLYRVRDYHYNEYFKAFVDYLS